MCLYIQDEWRIGQHMMERELFTSQEEADTRDVLHLFHAEQGNAESKPLVFLSSDTDVFVLLLTFVQNINSIVLFDTGKGNER